MPFRARRSLALVFVLIAAVCVRLGLWQIARLHQRRAANAAALAARAAPPVSLNDAGVLGDTALVARRVVAVGRYDHEHDLVLRGQVTDGVPGVHVVSPLLLGGGTAVLVDRGFVPSPDATTVALDPLREFGRVRVEGIALPFPADRRGGVPLDRGGVTSWARLDLAGLRGRLPYPILGVYVRQAPGPSLPRVPQRLPPPPIDDGPHLNYAIQWFSFAALALVFGGVVLWNDRRG